MDHLLLHPHPSVTTAARHFVTDWSRRHNLDEDTVERVELLTSEVVGNAVVHGTSSGDAYVLVSITNGPDPRPDPTPGRTSLPEHPDLPEQLDNSITGIADDTEDPPRTSATAPRSADQTSARGVLVCVSDAGSGRPHVKSLTQDATGGRGLAMVDLLANDWGVTAPTPAGYCYPPTPLAAAGMGGGTGGKTTWFLLT